MKILKNWLGVAATGFFLTAATMVQGADKKEAKPYPLETCVVSDEKLDSMGEPYVFTEKGQEVKLCCKSCLKDFKKDKDKYLKKLDEANAKKKPAKSAK
jgi:hypothetical protein